MAFVVANDKVEDFLKEKADKDQIKQIYKVAERFEKHHKQKPQTNADAIRAMSDEELADLISDPVTYSFNCGMCPANPQFGSCVHRCKPHILKWLKSEVKE